MRRLLGIHLIRQFVDLMIRRLNQTSRWMNRHKHFLSGRIRLANVALLGALLLVSFNNCAPAFKVMSEAEINQMTSGSSLAQPFQPTQPSNPIVPNTPAPNTPPPNPPPSSGGTTTPPREAAPQPPPPPPPVVVAPPSSSGGGTSPLSPATFADVLLPEQTIQTVLPSLNLADWTQVANPTQFWGKKLELNLAQYNSRLQINPVSYQIVAGRWNNLVSLPASNSAVSAAGNFSWTQIVPGNFGRHEFRIRATSAGGQTQDLLLPARVELPENTPRLCEQITRDYCRFLNERWAQGMAAGNLEDFYYNMDGGHSTYPTAQHSRQIKVVGNGLFAGGAPAKKRAIVGNASVTYATASADRNGMFSQMAFDGRLRLMRDNTMYWYPAHTDFHGSGEVFHYNSILSNVTKGSSGSDLEEVGRTLIVWSALRPDVKMKLLEEGLLVPVTQYFLRRYRVNSDADYLSGAAHALVMFRNADSEIESRYLQMAQAANAMTMENLLPFAQLNVISEDWSASAREQLATTPWAIHRIWRGPQYKKTVILSAENSFDWNGRPLMFQWVALRGAHAVVIEPLDAQGRRARLTFTWHPPYRWTPLQPNAHNDLTWRVDIGLFAMNSVGTSAPAMFTSFTLMSEARTYSPQEVLLKTDKAYHTDHVSLQ